MSAASLFRFLAFTALLLGAADTVGDVIEVMEVMEVADQRPVEGSLASVQWRRMGRWRHRGSVEYKTLIHNIFIPDTPSKTMGAQTLYLLITSILHSTVPMYQKNC